MFSHVALGAMATRGPKKHRVETGNHGSPDSPDKVTLKELVASLREHIDTLKELAQVKKSEIKRLRKENADYARKLGLMSLRGCKAH